DRQMIAESIEVSPQGSALPAGLREAIVQSSVCTDVAVCRVFLQEDGETAAVVGDGCAPPLVAREEQTEPGNYCSINVEPFVFEDGAWYLAMYAAQESPDMTFEQERESLSRERAAIERGDVMVGPSRKREIYIDGKSVSRPFD
ncbi:MAG TPA: hypothetical protein VLA37_07050, partial [Sphingomonadaceae bacterium]|nr:hypothetical protein [Sphingomonadaceae bacterium]